MATEITDDDIVNAALAPIEAKTDAGSVKARPLADLLYAQAILTRSKGWNPWRPGSRAVPPDATGNSRADIS